MAWKTWLKLISAHNYRVNPSAGGGLAADWRPRSPAAGYAERWAESGRANAKEETGGAMGSAEIQGDLWGREARHWAELQEPLHRPLWEAMLTAAAVGSGTRLLDAGCGGGGASLLAAQRGASITGLDAAGSLIDVARKRLPDAEFRVGDLQELPFDVNSFDAVVAASSLQYTQDRVATLRELKRVCDPSGRIVVALWSTPEDVEYRVVFKAVRDCLPEPPPGKGPFELSQPGVLEGLIETAGMKVAGSGKAACPFEYESFDVFWKANVSAGPLQAALQSVSEDRLRAAVREAVAVYERPGGSLRMENLFRYVVAVQ
jgi:SAM-dependent methyltransferase